MRSFMYPPRRGLRPAAAHLAVGAGAVVILALVTTGAWLAAHEGHNTAPQRPVYRPAQAGDTSYRIGMAMLPQDAVVGEDVRFEFQVLQLPDPTAGPAPGRPVTAGDVQVRIIATSAEPIPLAHVGPGEKPGTYTTRHRFTDSGQFAVATTVKAGADTITAEFPIAVGAGPVFRTTLLLDGVVLLIFGALLVSRWRARETATADTSSSLARDGALATVGMAVLIGSHVWVSPQVGRLFLPERHFGGIAWDMATPGGDAPAGPVTPHVDPPGTPPHTHPPGTPPHSHPGDKPGGRGGNDDNPSADLVSTVVPVPGQLVDVRVPHSARVLFEGFTPRVGATVRRGQTIATLEYHYILHDAVHLVNQRWVYMVPMLAARRASLEADLAAARTRHLAEKAESGVRQAMQVMQAVGTADLTAATARLELQRAQKLLAMHTAEINETDLVRRPMVSPIDGVIESVNFTHGQLKYENDKLFTILDLSRVWVEARFPEQMAARKPPGRLQFVSAAFPDRPFEGRLARVANTLDPATGTLSAFFEVPNPQRQLRIGMRLAAHAPGGVRATSGTTAQDVRRAVATSAADPGNATTLSLSAIIKPKTELSAEVVAPLWGRIEFAGRRLHVGDAVKKGEDLAHVILELAADERYQMNARAVDIAAERELSRTRREQAEKRWREATELLKASPKDPFRQEEATLLTRIYESAKEEEELLIRQIEVYKGVIKRRDPKITVVKAPISGVITEINFRPGELNGTDEFRRLFTIVNTSRVWLEAQVYDHQSAAVLKSFTRASFSSPGLASARPLERPIAVSGVVNPETGALSVIFDVANPGGALKIGGSAQLLIPWN